MRVLELLAISECVGQRLQNTSGLICPQCMDTEKVKERPIVIDVLGVAQHKLTCEQLNSHQATVIGNKEGYSAGQVEVQCDHS